MTAAAGGSVPAGGPRVLRETVRRHRGALVGGTALLCAYQAAEAAVPVVLGVVVDTAVRDGDGRSLLAAVAVLGAVIATVSVSWRTGMRVLQRANARAAHRWRVAVAAHCLQPLPLRPLPPGRRLPAGPLGTGDVLTVATDDADQAADVLEVVPNLVSSAVAVGVVAAVLAGIDAALGAVLLLGTAATTVALAALSRTVSTRTARQQEVLGRATARVADLVAGLRSLHGVGGSPAASRRYRALSRDALARARSVAGVSGAYQAAAVTSQGLLTVLVGTWGCLQALAGRLTAGEVVTVVGLAQFAAEPLGLFARMPRHLALARVSAGRIGELLAVPPVAQPDPAADPPAGQGVPHVAVRCAAAGPGVRVEVAPGEFLAVAVLDDAVERALVAALAGNDPAAVELAGTAGVGAVRWRADVLALPRRPEVFPGTFRSNLALGGPLRPGPLGPVAVAALGDVLELHDGGLDHPLQDRGANLSGGQRQRLALARALAADPPVLVLHDPTTALDAVTEQAVAAALPAARAGRSTLVLTTAPALLAVADRVLVLGAGGVLAAGTHEELRAGHARYAGLVAR